MKIWLILLLACACQSIILPSNEMGDVLIVEVGIGTDDLLELDGYQIVTNSVDWMRCGQYEVIYYCMDEPQYFSKMVHIIDAVDLDEGLTLYQDVSLGDVGTFTYKVKDCIDETDDSYFLVGSVDLHESHKQTILLQEYAFIRYYRNDELSFEKIFTLSYGYISWGQLSEAGLIYYLTYTMVENTNVQLGEITRNGIVLRSCDFGGSGNEIGYNAFYDDGKITLLFSSSSTDVPWTVNPVVPTSLVFLQVEESSWEIVCFRLIGNNRSNRVIDSALVNGFLYCLIEVLGSQGDFSCDSNNSYQTHLLILDQSLSVVHSISISLFDGAPRMAWSDRFIYIIYSQTIDHNSQLKVMYYDVGLGYLGCFYYQCPTPNSQLSYRHCMTSEEGLTYLFLDEIDCLTGIRRFSGAYVVQNDSLQPWFYSQELSNSRGGCCHNEWFVVGQVGQTLTKIKLVTIQTPLYQVHAHAYYVISQQYVLINNVMCGYIGEPHLQDEYGFYQDPVLFNGPGATVVLMNEYYVPLSTNLTSEATYDCGFRPQFNGVGYLNEELFVSGTPLLNTGQYQLVVIGKENSRKTIFFNVDDLTPSYPAQQSREPFTFFQQREAPADFPVIDIVPLSQAIDHDSDYTGWIVMALLIISGALIGWVMRPLWRKHR
ncbi:MAG: hypothetical protein WCT17_03790 [Bacilli bacterium]